MKLPTHLRSDIDYLIPDTILQACEFDRFDVEIELTGSACGGKHPQVRVWVDSTVIWDGTVEPQCQIKFSKKLDMQRKSVALEIEMYGKDDATGTRVDSLGQIIENQSVSLTQIIVNDIDIIKNRSIYNFGNYQLNLSMAKQKYFQQHGHNYGPSHCLEMTENGTWSLHFDLPVARSIARAVAPQYAALKWPDYDLLTKIVEQCDRVAKLQQQLRNKKEFES